MLVHPLPSPRVGWGVEERDARALMPPPTSPRPGRKAAGTPSLPPLPLDAAPFYPGSLAGRRTKRRRWVDVDGEESDNDHTASYLEDLVAW